jgi:hypothetical protein
MKSLILVAMLSVATVCASQPVSQVPNYAETGAIRVIGRGKTFEEAKTNGFNNAIEIVVGSLVITDTELSKNQFVRDDIAKHSAGYVDNYKIINKSESDLGVSLVMDVNVKSSKIHERVLSKPGDTAKLEGEKLADQYNTYMQNRESGDKLLNTILGDFSKYAFNLKKGETFFKLDEFRNAILVVEYELSWNQKYLKALNEALAVTSDEGNRGLDQERVFIASKDPGAWLFGSTNRYYFNDKMRARRVKQTFLGSTTVWGEIKDSDGKVIFRGCSQPIHMVGAVMHDPMIVRGNEKIQNEVMIKIPADSPIRHKMNNAVKVELSFSNGGCYNFNQ